MTITDEDILPLLQMGFTVQGRVRVRVGLGLGGRVRVRYG